MFIDTDTKLAGAMRDTDASYYSRGNLANK